MYGHLASKTITDFSSFNISNNNNFNEDNNNLKERESKENLNELLKDNYSNNNA